MKKMQNMISTDNSQLNIKNTVNCKIEGLSGLNNWLNSVSSEESRKSLIDKGIQEATLFYNNYQRTEM